MESGVSDLPLHYSSDTWFMIIILITTFTLIGSLGILERNSMMPSTLSIWKKKDISEGSIGRMSLVNALKCTTDSM